LFSTKQNKTNGKSGHDSKQHTKGGLEKTKRVEKIERKERFEWLVDHTVDDRQDRVKWDGEWEKNNTSVSREMKKRTTTNFRILIISNVSRSEKIKSFPIQLPTRTTVTPTRAYPDFFSGEF
jgi:hypothetical protein